MSHRLGVILERIADALETIADQSSFGIALKEAEEVAAGQFRQLQAIRAIIDTDELTTSRLARIRALLQTVPQ